MTENKETGWCLFRLDACDIRETASEYGLVLNEEDFDEIADLTRKGFIEWAVDDNLSKRILKQSIEYVNKEREKNIHEKGDK